MLRSTSEPAGRRWAWLERLGRLDVGQPRILWILLGVSLLLRLVGWGLAVRYDLPLRGDEKGYYARAQAYAEILGSFAGWHWPDAVTWLRAYGMGKWTPLQPLTRTGRSRPHFQPSAEPTGNGCQSIASRPGNYTSG